MSHPEEEKASVEPEKFERLLKALAEDPGDEDFVILGPTKFETTTMLSMRARQCQVHLTITPTVFCELNGPMEAWNAPAMTLHMSQEDALQVGFKIMGEALAAETEQALAMTLAEAGIPLKGILGMLRNVRQKRADWEQADEFGRAALSEPFNRLIDVAFPPEPADPDRACRVCGCTHTTPCFKNGEPCAWAEPDLCTACVGKEQ